MMMRIAEKIASYHKCGALITGESLGQVASQTLPAIGVTDAVTKMPVLRPLIGSDKEDIIKISRKIDTFETSCLPYEDCCTVFTPKHPKTRPTVEQCEEAEKSLNIDELVEFAIQNTVFTYID
jgi:thiamine biosynthesis protein ThiI